jgi:hypothetical protein
LDLLDQATIIISNFKAQGYRLSLRQLYYQMVKANLIENTDKMYKRLGTLIKNARLAGIVDWYMIEDRGRRTNRNSHWEDAGDIMETVVDSFAIDKWADQPIYMEVMVEKEDMTDDLVSRLGMFARSDIQVKRLALNMPQVEKYQPPENPAKVKDTRYQAYMVQFGTASWELDALTPDVLGELVEDYILQHRDTDLWIAAEEEEEGYRQELQEIVDKYK